MTDNIKWYIEFISHELDKLKEGRFTGNVEFKVNWKEGQIANMNVILAKSVRNIEKGK